MKFALDEQQRDFAASIDAALGAADLPGAIRAWSAGDTAPGRKVWEQLADLGVTALAVPEKFDGIEAHPVDLVVALERLGRWCVPGPVAESIAVAPVLLASDEQAERCAALASGELIATVALPPQTPRAVDADTAGLVLLATDDGVAEAAPGDRHESVDPSRPLYDVTATGQAWQADRPARLRVRGAGHRRAAGRRGRGAAARHRRLRQAAGAVRPGDRLLSGDQAQARRRAHRDRAGPAAAVRRGVVSGRLPSETARDVSAAKAAASDAGLLAARSALQTHGAIGFTQEHDLSLWLLRVQALRSAWGTPPRRIGGECWRR